MRENWIHKPIFYSCRFSSGDLSSECDDAEQSGDATAGNRPPPLQTQPVGTGPPNIPPPAGK